MWDPRVTLSHLFFFPPSTAHLSFPVPPLSLFLIPPHRSLRWQPPSLHNPSVGDLRYELATPYAASTTWGKFAAEVAGRRAGEGRRSSAEEPMGREEEERGGTGEDRWAVEGKREKRV
jgi:hypothetical protein